MSRNPTRTPTAGKNRRVNRRQFIGAGVGLAVTGTFAGRLMGADGGSLRILILGGTGFLGPQIVNVALARGHTVTLFNRGKTNPGLFPDLETIIGDRDGGLAGLARRRWDVVVDTSGYLPRLVGDSARALVDAVERYLFISTISVYRSLAVAGIDESAPLGTLQNPDTETVDGETYGPLKALCEQAVNVVYGDKATIIRPGLIVGPGDRTDRFTYWPVRIARGGRVLAPGDGLDPVQFIDVRDLAAWTVHCLEQRVSGVYNANGPRGALDMQRLLSACQTVAGGSATLRWADQAVLAELGVEPWTDMPVWVPRGGDFAGAADASVARAVARGLRSRPVTDTARATLDWFTDSRGLDSPLRTGLSPEREAGVLEQLDAMTRSG